MLLLQSRHSKLVVGAHLGSDHSPKLWVPQAQRQRLQGWQQWRQSCDAVRFPKVQVGQLRQARKALHICSTTALEGSRQQLATALQGC